MAAPAPAWTVTTVAGNGRAGFRDGTGTKEGTAEFDGPVGVACDAAGVVYVADDRNHAIRRIGPDGATTTVAGSGAPGFRDGTGPEALFRNPRAIAAGAGGSLYVADTGNNRIRKIAPDGRVTTLAGAGRAGFADGPGARAAFDAPAGLAVDAAGIVFVADTGNHRIRRVQPDGSVTTLAGNGRGQIVDGSGGAGSTASFFFPDAIALGPDRTLYVLDGRSQSVRVLAPDGTTLTPTPDGRPPQLVVWMGLVFPVHGIAADAEGNLLVTNQQWIDRLARGTWKLQPVAGLIAHGFSDGSGDRDTGTADFDRVTSLARCPDGTFVVADTGNNSVRRLSPMAA
ncbi:MAG TPA: SMP-30/gluconolactonase/LRE family protein, partial [Polyangia bacterium]